MKTETRQRLETAPGMVEELAAKYAAPLSGPTGKTPFRLRAQLQECNWAKVGVVRNGPDMEAALEEIASIRKEAKKH